MVLIKSDLRSVIIEILARDRPYDPNAAPYQLQDLCTEIAILAKERTLKYAENINAWLDNRYHNPELHPNLTPWVWNIVWDLIIEGILRPGNGKSEYNLPYIHVTDFGKEAIKGSISPYAPAGYLKAITDKVPNVDPIIMRYVAESAETLRRNCLLSSTVTLGCASEQAFLLLLEAYRNALNPADQAAFDQSINKSWMIKTKHFEFIKAFDAKLKLKLKGAFDSNWITECETALQFIFGYFHSNRNDAGHPSDAMFSREISSAHLIMFPTYLRVIYDLIEWLPKHKPV